MTDVEDVARQVGDLELRGRGLKLPSVLTPGQLEDLLGQMGSLDDAQKIEFAGKVESTRKDLALVVGLMLYDVRGQKQDGAWGSWKREFTAQTGMSDRTISRRIAAAADFFGLELSPAQANARAGAAPDARPQEGQAGGEDDEWDDEEEAEAAGFRPYSEDEDLVARLNRDAGWGDDTLPSADYVNVEPPPPARRAVIPVDETWSAFTQQQIVAEHPHLAGVGAERAAKLRWDRATREEPLELLEQLEMIHDGSPPDELVEALYAAEEQKALKPDEVIEPEKKKRSGGGGGAKTPEGIMSSVRELHQQIVKTREEQGAAAVVAKWGGDVATIQGLIHTAQGCLTKLRNAIETTKQTGGARDPGETPGF